MNAPTPRKRRSPITRAEGEKRLVDATIELLLEKQFTDVGVRDIAARADVNHGFVHTWFGSKNDLFLAVLKELMRRISETVRSTPEGALAGQPFDPHTQLAIRLVMWLKLEGADTASATGDETVIRALTDRYVTHNGMTPEVAHLAAQQTVAIATGAVIYGDIIQVRSSTDVQKVMALWQHIIGLLGKYPPA